MKALGETMIEEIEDRRGVLDGDRRATIVQAANDLIESSIAMRALQVGDVMPDFSLPAVDGSLVRLSEVLRAGPAVVAFLRGRWCEYCRSFVQALADSYEHVRAADGTVLAISPQQEGLEGARELPFPWLLDADNGVARIVGVSLDLPPELGWAYRELGIDVPKLNQSDPFELPVPATYVVGGNRSIRFAHVEPDYRWRPTMKEVVGAVQRAAAAAPGQLLIPASLARDPRVLRTDG